MTKTYVAFDDNQAGLKNMSNDALAIQNLWVPIERAETNIRIRSNKETSTVINRTKFPLMLACGCTVHKVQDITLEEVVISFDLLRQRNFNYAQMYVALSRLTSLNGLYLIGKFNLAAIWADPRTINEYHQMRKEKQLAPVIIPSISNKSLSLILLNTRSFSKNATDISKDRRLLQADILYLTETQILPAKNAQMPEQHLSELQFLQNRSEDKFQSITLDYKHNIEVLSYDEMPGRSYLSLSEISFMNFSKP